MVQIGLRVPESVHGQLKELAEDDGRSIAAYVRRIVENALGIAPQPAPPKPRARRTP